MTMKPEATTAVTHAPPKLSTASKPIHIIKRGEHVTLHNVPPTRTLLQVLREDLRSTGTKEGCNEGDCGACTVVVAELDSQAPDGLRYQSVNSCIRFAHSIDGKALWTAEDIANEDGSLHPAQQAMVNCFGSQCGFCTPGFVMSLFATYQNRVCQGQTVTRELAQHDLSGNLCRCTGYRPIVDAALGMHLQPKISENTAKILSLLKHAMELNKEQNTINTYEIPGTLNKLLQTRAQKPTAQIVAGCTDVGLWVKINIPDGQLDTVEEKEDQPKSQNAGGNANQNPATPKRPRGNRSPQPKTNSQSNPNYLISKTCLVI